MLTQSPELEALQKKLARAASRHANEMIVFAAACKTHNESYTKLKAAEAELKAVVDEHVELLSRQFLSDAGTP